MNSHTLNLGLGWFHTAIQPENVLLIEDDPHWQLIIGRTLKTFNKDIKLRCVRTAKHAQELLFQSANYDLIIADHYLGGDSTGLDFWRSCRENYAHIPFMMISGVKQAEFFELISQEQDTPLFLEKNSAVEGLQNILGWTLPNLGAQKELSVSPTLNFIKAAVILVLLFALVTPLVTHVKEGVSELNRNTDYLRKYPKHQIFTAKATPKPKVAK